MSTHHIVLIPRDPFATACDFDATGTTGEGYFGATIYTETLPVYAEALQSALGDHLLEFSWHASTTNDAGAPEELTLSNFASQSGTINLLMLEQVTGHRPDGYVNTIPVYGIALPIFYHDNTFREREKAFWTCSICPPTKAYVIESNAEDGNGYPYEVLRSNGTESEELAYVRPFVLFG